MHSKFIRNQASPKRDLLIGALKSKHFRLKKFNFFRNFPNIKKDENWNYYYKN